MKVVYRINDGAFVDSMDDYNKHLQSQGVRPTSEWNRMVTARLIKEKPDNYVHNVGQGM